MLGDSGTLNLGEFDIQKKKFLNYTIFLIIVLWIKFLNTLNEYYIIKLINQIFHNENIFRKKNS
ncbi:MAG: hypothetical protein EA359_13995 [Balneolaceae bacterium]|nr:MAG: hypothetical protein EA359_13995 [Balneolaceae bacterium]